MTPVSVGFMPLVDCAPLAVARENGFARAEGLDLALVRETSWANIRDRVALGHVYAAHMLGPMPIAASLGIGRDAVPTVAPIALGLGGNAVTLATNLFDAMREAAPARATLDGYEPMAVGRALAAVLAARRRGGRDAPALAVVHPFSAHHYMLRYWLRAAGIDPDADVRLTVVPPADTVAALRSGAIEGFCAGEPWGSLAVEAGLGVMAVTTAAIWRQGPDKVLGMRADVAARQPDVTAALLRALVRAADWAGAPGNRADLVAMLAGDRYLATPAATVRRALDGRLVRAPDAAPAAAPDFLLFDRAAATFPWRSHALWFYAAMVRAGHVAHTAERARIARDAYRPDLYRAALGPTGADLPRADAKVEGALQHPTPVASRSGRLLLGPDPFCDGRLFDPDRLDQYLSDRGDRPPDTAE